MTAEGLGVKFCKDCRHYQEEFVPDENKTWSATTYMYHVHGEMKYWCASPAWGRDLITGNEMRMDCKSARGGAKCGQAGKLWQPKHSTLPPLERFKQGAWQ